MNAPNRPTPSPGPGRLALAGVRFASEVAGLVGAAAVGAAAGLIGAIAGAMAFAVVWGMAVAPKSRRRLPDPGRLALEVALFGLVAGGLVERGRPLAGGALAIVAIGAAIALRAVPGTPGLDP